MKMNIDQVIKLSIKIDKPNGCINCPFFSSGSYGDMGATISYCECGANQYKKDNKDGRIIANLLEVHPFAFSRNNKNHMPKTIIYKGCTIWNDNKEMSIYELLSKLDFEYLFRCIDYYDEDLYGSHYEDTKLILREIEVLKNEY